MNFDGYAQYMQQKYRLAITLAVIKTKPSGTHLNDHVNSIINNLSDFTTLDDGVCEEDFNYNDNEPDIQDFNDSDDSVTILKDFVQNNEAIDQYKDGNTFFNDEINIDTRNEDEKHSSVDETQCKQDLLSDCTDNDKTFCESDDFMEAEDDIIDDSQINDVPKNQIDSQATVLYTVHDTNTHISQSEENIVVKKIYFNAKKDKTVEDNDTENLEQTHERAQIVNNLNDFVICGQDNSGIDDLNHTRENLICLNSQIHGLNDESKMTVSMDCSGQNNMDKTDTPRSLTSLTQNSFSLNEHEYCSDKRLDNKRLYSEIDGSILKNHQDPSAPDDESADDGLTESQAEMVSFKVLEELSRIKSYLNKADNKLSEDSGYRSWKNKSSRSVSQSSCLNESAYCLMSFLKSCPLAVNIMDIVEEISKVLGRFVDKLHDAETYPKFLDDMLDSVGGLVNDLYESSVDGDLMLEVDEKIQRIFLLNRSHHIMRYTIELITGKLEKLHTKLCDSIEITQTATTENLCYMLHILEILLRRYTAIDNVSQSSVDSQGSVLRKNSLTDIWRRKWNLSDSDVRVSEKTCIVTECRRVLNKILVQAIDNYSLISFSALQCLNIIQK
ncbi:uncharacterized protein LOC116778261 [Danaus plexippus]|uniref:uncharacterized protein LOC116778261 n=1 Tax=Danaus plexippus TaxID=13037 RepID=UPI002AAF3FED|nr:uncharacterized protein LOC116778261 [Danaus plexippus]